MQLKGKKVILRPIRLSDAPRYVRWFNDPSVNRFMNIRHMTLVDERKAIRDIMKNKNRVNFAIEVEGVHIGSTGCDINHKNNRAGWGIIIGDKRYWNRGFGTDAGRTMIEYLFKKYKFNRIELDVYSYNPRAQALYKKMGFKFEGKKRKHNFFGGKYHDVYVMGMLRTEWNKRSRKNI